jgi:hypothetical protein
MSSSFSAKKRKRDVLDTVRNDGLDKFYTTLPYAKHCIQTVFTLCTLANVETRQKRKKQQKEEEKKDKAWDLIVEPSAGNGSFLYQLPPHIESIGLDICPDKEEEKEKRIIQQDFFEFVPPADKTNILTIGNPPFGKACSLAIRFFNHAAQWSKTIAFIVPKTFRRISVQNKLDMSFYLVHDEDVPMTPCPFYPTMEAKCCFQIWQRGDKKRQPVVQTTHHADWTFLPWGPLDEFGQPTPPSGADFAMRAYGGQIGEIVSCVEQMQTLRPKSWHWFKSNIDTAELMCRFEQLDYSNSMNTARQNSLGKGELVQLYTDFFC